MYRLVYYIGTKRVEVTVQNAPLNVCKWKKAILSESTHKLGTFKIERI